MTMFNVSDSLIQTSAAEAITTKGPVQLSIRNTALSGTIGAYGSSVNVATSKTTAQTLLTVGQQPANFRIFATYRTDPSGAFVAWLST